MQTIAVSRPSRRRSVRRAVELPCAVTSELWDGSVSLPACNLSPDGLWLSSPLPLELGERVELAFRPPRRAVGDSPVLALAQVVRVALRRRRADADPTGMGVRFLEMSYADRGALESSLRGLPPPLPRRARPARDTGLYGHIDPEALIVLDDEVELRAWRALAPLLTSSRAQRTEALPPALVACVARSFYVRAELQPRSEPILPT